MDSILTTLVTAIVSGATAAVTQVAATPAVENAYAQFKKLVIRKLDGKADVANAIQQVEGRPHSAGRQEVLREELEAAVTAEPTVAQDQDLLTKAQELLKLLKEQEPQTVQIIQTGSGGIAHGSGAKAAGERGVVAGTIHGSVNTGDHARQIQAETYLSGGVRIGEVAGGIHGSVIAGRDANNVNLDSAAPDDDPVTQSPALQKLRAILSSLYETEPDARRMAQESGLDTRQVNFSTGAANFWHHVLVEAHKQDKVKALVATVNFEYPEQAEALRQAYGAYVDHK